MKTPVELAISQMQTLHIQHRCRGSYQIKIKWKDANITQRIGQNLEESIKHQGSTCLPQLCSTGQHKRKNAFRLEEDIKEKPLWQKKSREERVKDDEAGSLHVFIYQACGGSLPTMATTILQITDYKFNCLLHVLCTPSCMAQTTWTGSPKFHFHFPSYSRFGHCSYSPGHVPVHALCRQFLSTLFYRSNYAQTTRKTVLTVSEEHFGQRLEERFERKEREMELEWKEEQKTGAVNKGTNQRMFSVQRTANRFAVLPVMQCYRTTVLDLSEQGQHHTKMNNSDASLGCPAKSWMSIDNQTNYAVVVPSKPLYGLA
ncbi:hypothetical protein JEQ12_016589 [Ovis aries]|uniref:Uncharacterized protein n=1 Tax=Ovis aries TaxID=9940 RepID=A0A836A3L0_SHEEP|nr:hypothetical protein JEQ12_016589 [Ovis aries]